MQPLPFQPDLPQSGVTAALEPGRHEHLEALLGHTFEIGPNKYRLFKCATAHPTAAGRKAFRFTDKVLFTVQPGSVVGQACAGVADPNLGALLVGDYVLLKTKGEVELITGDDGAARPTLGEYVVIDDDADLGKVAGSGVAQAGADWDESFFAIAKATTAANDVVFKADIVKELI